MFFVILAVIVVVAPFIIGAWYYHDVGVGAEDFWIPWLASLLIGILVFTLASLFVVMFVDCFAEKEPVVVETVEINALKDNFLIEGSGSGSILISSVYIDEELNYTYKYYADGKGWSTATIPASDSYINKLPEGEKPYIEIREMMPISKAVKFWFTEATYGKEYIIYVPYDAQITEEFIIDFE